MATSPVVNGFSSFAPFEARERPSYNINLLKPPPLTFSSPCQERFHSAQEKETLIASPLSALQTGVNLAKSQSRKLSSSSFVPITRITCGLDAKGLRKTAEVDATRHYSVPRAFQLTIKPLRKMLGREILVRSTFRDVSYQYDRFRRANMRCKMLPAACVASSSDGNAPIRNSTLSATQSVPRVLTVAGSDSGGGAGIQADLKACAALGAFGTVAITALTAQNTQGVQGVHLVPGPFLEAQLESVLGDIGTNCVKTGMLPSAEIIETLCRVLARSTYDALVVDPVLVATSGDELAGTAVLPALRGVLFPLADLVTPNLPEAAAILGWSSATITDVEGMKKAAELIHQMGPRHVLIKGGHLPDSEKAVDVFYDGVAFEELHSERIGTRNSHGTGCTLASAIAAELAKGKPMREAVRGGKEYVTAVLRASKDLAIGQGAQGPLNHFPSLAPWGHEDSSPRARFRPSDLTLYAVTDPRMNARWQRSMEQAVTEAIAGGATFLQIREKDSDTGDFVRVAEAAVQIARAAGIPLVINDRVDVALAVDADGVHVGQSDMPAAKVRSLLGPSKIIGVSCKTVAHAQKAFVDGADYVGVGGVYPTMTKENNKTIGIEGLRNVCAESPLPVVAIGGIKRDKLREVLEVRHDSSLAGVAIVSAVFDVESVESSTRSLREHIDELMQRSTSEAGLGVEKLVSVVQQ
eukprot:TRINITY_DN965_c0_g1_i6.p1 TRINITY_DN965_c0_g1~~TRINITY_DN965_c0_g1_i6.p1  ORF type:complete len:717 (+),score=82.09 TRINITY_DN965_c0_g1_i6:67-2151(+)